MHTTSLASYLGTKTASLTLAKPLFPNMGLIAKHTKVEKLHEEVTVILQPIINQTLTSKCQILCQVNYKKKKFLCPLAPS